MKSHRITPDDEVFAASPKSVHLERMDKDHWWMGIELNDGKTLHIDLTSKALIGMKAWQEQHAGKKMRRVN